MTWIWIFKTKVQMTLQVTFSPDIQSALDYLLGTVRASQQVSTRQRAVMLTLAQTNLWALRDSLH